MLVSLRRENNYENWRGILENKTIKICDECESKYFADSSKMANLCPNCSHYLYGYKNCQHIFIDGRCINCYVDEKIFIKMENTRWK